MLGGRRSGVPSRHRAGTKTVVPWSDTLSIAAVLKLKVCTYRDPVEVSLSVTTMPA